MDPNRVWKLKTPAYGLNAAPVAFRHSLKRYLLQREVSLKIVGLKFTVSALDPRLYVVFNKDDEAAGVFSSNIDDILGRGAPGVLERKRYSSRQRIGSLETQENDFVHVGMD